MIPVPVKRFLDLPCNIDMLQIGSTRVDPLLLITDPKYHKAYKLCDESVGYTCDMIYVSDMSRIPSRYTVTRCELYTSMGGIDTTVYSSAGIWVLLVFIDVGVDTYEYLQALVLPTRIAYRRIIRPVMFSYGLYRHSGIVSETYTLDDISPYIPLQRLKSLCSGTVDIS